MTFISSGQRPRMFNNSACDSSLQSLNVCVHEGCHGVDKTQFADVVVGQHNLYFSNASESTFA